jgi:hypothetical protein
MNTAPLAVALLACLAVASAPQEGPGGAPVGPAAEPPQRVRLTLGSEVLELPFGAVAETADGRSVRLDLLPVRHFDAPGSFSFDYPRAWRFTGATGSPSPEAGWWSLAGEGVAVTLRRHTGDAETIREQYLSNLESTQRASRVRATIDLDGRFLVGGAVTYASRSIGIGALTSNWEQSVFAWQESEGVAWLLTLQRQFEPASATDALRLMDKLRLDLERQLAQQLEVEARAWREEHDVATRPTPPAPPSLGHPELDALRASFRWQRR